MASDIVDNVLQEVSDSADRLEENMHRRDFGGSSNLRKTLETVVKLEEDDKPYIFGFIDRIDLILIMIHST